MRRARSGRYVISLGAEDRAVLRSLPGQLRTAIEVNRADPSLRRLFPPAYVLDDEAEQEYRRLMGTDLDERRAEALDTLARTAGATELSAEEMDAWLRALNDIRLWLGTLLDVTEDEEPEPAADPAYMLYRALTALQSLVVDALCREG
ncbi:MAG TPA: DUF2017 family protein [Acidimicrobiales bacterium]|nr:DUF2017 family protein [Acidimicrobiales bacterium]